MPFSGRPPPRIPSSPSSPLLARSSTNRSPPSGRATSALDPSRSFTVETSSSGSTGFCRKASAPAASASSRASRTERAITAPSSCCFRRLHSSAPRPPEIISSTIASGAGSRATAPRRRRRRGHLHVVALGAQEELCEVRRHGVALGDQHEQPRPGIVLRLPGWPSCVAFGEQAVGVGRREPARHLRRDEAQLLHVVARVQPMPAAASLRARSPRSAPPSCESSRRGARASAPPRRCCRRRGCHPLDRTRLLMLTDRALTAR